MTISTGCCRAKQPWLRHVAQACRPRTSRNGNANCQRNQFTDESMLRSKQQGTSRAPCTFPLLRVPYDHRTDVFTASQASRSRVWITHQSGKGHRYTRYTGSHKPAMNQGPKTAPRHSAPWQTASTGLHQYQTVSLVPLSPADRTGTACRPLVNIQQPWSHKNTSSNPPTIEVHPCIPAPVTHALPAPGPVPYRTHRIRYGCNARRQHRVPAAARPGSTRTRT